MMNGQYTLLRETARRESKNEVINLSVHVRTLENKAPCSFGPCLYDQVGIRTRR